MYNFSKTRIVETEFVEITENDFVYNITPMDKSVKAKVFKLNTSRIDRHVLMRQFSINLSYIFLEDLKMQMYNTKYTFEVCRALTTNWCHSLTQCFSQRFHFSNKKLVYSSSSWGIIMLTSVSQHCTTANLSPPIISRRVNWICFASSSKFLCLSPENLITLMAFAVPWVRNKSHDPIVLIATAMWNGNSKLNFFPQMQRCKKTNHMMCRDVVKNVKMRHVRY